MQSGTPRGDPSLQYAWWTADDFHAACPDLSTSESTGRDTPPDYHGGTHPAALVGSPYAGAAIGRYAPSGVVRWAPFGFEAAHSMLNSGMLPLHHGGVAIRGPLAACGIRTRISGRLVPSPGIKPGHPVRVPPYERGRVITSRRSSGQRDGGDGGS